MGHCGQWQVAGAEQRSLREQLRHATFFGNGSHGLCTVFYNLAFEHKFPAHVNYRDCVSLRAASARYIANFSMGYLDALKHEGR